MAQKPSIPKGTRDFGPAEVARRNYIMETIRRQFEVFGFQPIETPSMENYDTLMGKYGEEGDRLIFKVLNSGDFLKKVPEDTYVRQDAQALTPLISEKALRYDLTVPFARYVVMHQNEIDFPFKRYQIQPVWRADRPQRGRFREFYQCDADVVGASGLVQELEFIQLYDRVFSDLGLKGVTIKVNHRKVLSGIAEIIGAGDRLTDFTVALDKLDKIGREKVADEMRQKGISGDAIDLAAPLFEMQGSAREQLGALRAMLGSSPTGLEGVSELEELLAETESLGLLVTGCELDVTLARGLNYYTGAIFEVAAPAGVPMGSIGGGGRYDDLTGIFGLRDVSGVGISFGLDRIYLVLEQLGLFPEALDRSLEVFCLNFGGNAGKAALKLVLQLRSLGIRADLYPNDSKISKQFKYADKRGVPYVVLIGDEELENGNFTVKNMKTGSQQTYALQGWETFGQFLQP
jgi:histidyl-tRNA synthetase